MSSSTNGQWYPPRVAGAHPRSGRGRAHARDAAAGRDRHAAARQRRRAGATGPAVHMLRRRASMAFAGGAYAYPGGGVDPRDERWAGGGWAGPGCAGRPWSGPSGSARTRPPRRPSSAPPSARPSRRRACCSPGPTPRRVVADTTGEDWEARPGGAGRPRAVLRRLPGPARAGAAQRPAGRLGALDHARVRAAPLRHLVLRRRAARGPAHAQRLHRGRPHGLDPARRRPPPATTGASC